MAHRDVETLRAQSVILATVAGLDPSDVDPRRGLALLIDPEPDSGTLLTREVAGAGIRHPLERPAPLHILRINEEQARSLRRQLETYFASLAAEAETPKPSGESP